MMVTSSRGLGGEIQRDGGEGKKDLCDSMIFIFSGPHVPLYKQKSELPHA